jgi:hypothetical protein
MNTHDDHHETLPGEDELKALYRSLPRKEPPAALDHAVKRAAADAVRATPRRATMRWPVAVTSVAMVIVAAGLGWRMLQQPAGLPQIPTSRIVAATTPPSAQPATPDSTAAANAAAERTASPVAPPPPRAIAAEPEKRESIRSAMKPKVVAPVVAARHAPAPLAAPAPMTSMNDESAYARASAAPAPVVAPPPAPPAPPAAIEASAAPQFAPMEAAPSQRLIAGRSGLAQAAVQTAAAPAPMQEATAVNPADTPSQELAKIRALFAQQRRDEALQRLDAFRKAHPEIALPDDLRAQLPDHE